MTQQLKSAHVRATILAAVYELQICSLNCSAYFSYQKSVIMPRITNEERERALSMLEAGLSNSEVARRLGCNHSTIIRLQRRVTETGSAADRHRSGRGRVTSHTQDRNIQAQHLRNRFRTAAQTARSRRISSSTVRRRLHSVNSRARMPYRGPVLNAISRENRLQWASQYRRWTQHQWSTVLFSDESRVCIDRPDRRQQIFSTARRAVFGCLCARGKPWVGLSVMVWGGISEHYTRTPLDRSFGGKHHS